MATEDDIKRWEEFDTRYNELLLEGAQNRLVFPYNEEFFSKVRDYYYGGLSIPVLLLHKNMVNGFCYDRAPLVTLGFKDNDYNVLYGDINSLKLNPKYIGGIPGYADHCIVEVEDDGMKWIFDTSVGLVFEKELYEKMENPIIRLVRTKEETIKFLETQVSSNLNEDEAYFGSLTLDLLENNLDPIQCIYEEALKREVNLLKKKFEDVKIKKKV